MDKIGYNPIICSRHNLPLGIMDSILHFTVYISISFKLGIEIDYGGAQTIFLSHLSINFGF